MLHYIGINIVCAGCKGREKAVYKMDSGGIVAIVLIGFFAIVLITVIIKAASSGNKSGSARMSGGYSPPPPGAYPPGPAVTPKQEEYVNSGPPQINVYMNRPARSMWRCPKCDGENECYAPQCQICGQLLR